MSRKIDMTGWIMSEHNVPDSKLVVIQEDKTRKSNKGEIYWICKCECGNIVSLKGTRIRNGSTKSCGKCHAENLIGWKIWEHGVPDSRWEVIGRALNNGSYGRPMWICKCQCGTIKSIGRSTLLSGESKSCGCLSREIHTKINMNRAQPIEIGQRFGKLTAIEDAGLKEYHGFMRRHTLCQCDCGSNPIIVSNNVLLTGRKLSCGCLLSSGELYIKQLLDKNKVNYKSQYTFSDLIGKENRRLRFDFAILNNDDSIQFLLEYDGQGHYKEPTGNWDNYTLEEIQERDKIKNEYCHTHNILLKRIPYTEKTNFTYEDIISNKYNI